MRTKHFMYQSGRATGGIIITVIILLVLIAGVWWLAARLDDEAPTPPEEGITLSQEYRNEEFGFVVRYPADWQVSAFPDDPIAPTFNIYPSEVTEEPPFTHHSAVTQVSIFPHGVPTEGVFGETRESTNFTLEEAQTLQTFVLADGTPWAVMATDFGEAPSAWQEWGFLWASAEVENLVTECVRDGVVIAMEECSPPATGTLVRRGNVSQETWETIEAIVNSFEFIEPTEQVARPYYTNTSEDMIVLDAPEPGETIGSPLTVTGRARGTWYFEATFPLVLTDWDGRIIAESFAEAQSDWMTEDFVPFEGTLTFTADTSVSDRGTLILQKANASGLPEHDAALEIPVRFE